MSQPSQNRVLFPHCLKQVGFLVFGLFFVIATLTGIISSLSPIPAHAATTSTLNFQARLQTSAGGIVPDGYYNIEFKIYDALSSSGSSQGSCSGDADCLWTETRYDSNGVTAGNDNRVRVKNGYLTVNLGSVTSLPSINWDQQLFITMRVGGTDQTTPTWDPEMSPRLSLTGVPYAFRAGMLATGNGTLQSTLQLLQPTVGNQVFQVRDQAAGGTYNLLTENEADAGYIQNGTSPQTADFNITGDGTIGDDLAITGDLNVTGMAGLGIAASAGIELGIKGAAGQDGNFNLADGNGTNTWGFYAATAGNFGIYDNANATAPLQIAPNTATDTLRLSSVGVGIGGVASYMLHVVGDINTTTGYRVAGTAGSSASCSGGQLLQNATVVGGIVTVGSCAADAGVTTVATFSGSSQANGASISGTTITFGPADATNPGMVSTGTQTFAGAKTFNGNVTVASGAVLTLAGQASSASTTEGTVYYDSDDDQLKVYANGKWQADRTTATKIVAASDSQNKEKADYVADGTDDQDDINAAIAALPSTGGLVYLLDGTYTIDDGADNDDYAIEVTKSNVTLMGQGAATVIKLKNTINANLTAVRNNPTNITSTTIRDLKLDGNKANNSSGTQYGVFFSSASASGGYSLVMDNVIVDSFRTNGVYTTSTGNIRIANSQASSNTGDGFHFNSGDNITVIGSKAHSNTGIGINAISGNNYAVFNGNTVYSNGSTGMVLSGANSTAIGNTVYSNTINGISTASSTTYATISGNTVSANTQSGIMIASSSTHNIVSGNTVYNNSQNGIIVQTSATNNIISANNIYNSGASGSFSGIDIGQGANYNRITDNRITDTAGTGYAISLTALGTPPAGVYIADNTFSGTGASTISDGGRGTIFGGQTTTNSDYAIQSTAGVNVGGTALGAASLNVQGAYLGSQLSSPSAPTLTRVGAAGSTSYTYAVSAYDGLGETLISSTANIATAAATLNGTDYVQVAFNRVGGAISYKVYRTASGGTPSSTGLIGTVAGGSANVDANGRLYLNDTGLAASGSAPAANTTGGGSFAGSLSITGNANLIKPSTNSVTAFQIQPASSSTPVFNVDTTNGRVGIGTNAPEGLLHLWGTGTNGAGATLYFGDRGSAANPYIREQGAGDSDILELAGYNGINLLTGAGDAFTITSGGNSLFGEGKTLILQNTTNANTLSLQSGVTSASYTLTLPTAVGASGDCLKTSNGTGTLTFGSCTGSGVTTVGTFSGSSQADGANITGTTITFGPADATNPGMVSTGTQTIAGAKTFTSKLNASSTVAADFSLQGVNASATGLGIYGYANSNTTNDVLRLDGSTGTVFNVRTNGSALLKSATGSDSITAFQVQKADASPIFNVDTTNGRVGVGTAAPGNKFHVSEANGAGDVAIKIQNNALTAGETASLIFTTTTTSSVASAQIQAERVDANGTKLHLGTRQAGALVNVVTIDETGKLGIGTSTPTEKLTIQGGNVLIGQQTNTAGGADTTWTKLTQATAGTIASSGTASIAGITASAMYNGSLYVGTTKSNAAEVYRYNGTSGSWTKVSQSTAGTIASGGTANIDAITSMIVYDGYLYVGTTETGAAQLYRFDGGTTWTVANTSAGDFGVGTTAIDGVSAMAVNSGMLYLGTAKSNSAQVYRYNGNNSFLEVSSTAGDIAGTAGSSTGVDKVTAMASYNGMLMAGTSNGTTGAELYQFDSGGTWSIVFGLDNTSCGGTSAAGRYCINGTAVTSANTVTSMAVHDGKLFMGIEKANAADLIYLENNAAQSSSTPSSQFVRAINTTGTVISGGTANIDAINALTVVNGRLYFGTKEADSAEIFRYNGGVGSNSSNTKVSQTTAGTIAASGTASIDQIAGLHPYNGSLIAYTSEGTSAELYSNTTVSNQSYALKFHAATTNASGEQNSLLNVGQISFAADSNPQNNPTTANTGAFLFTHGILTNSGAYDLAEDYGTRDATLQPGDLVAVDANEREMVRKAIGANDGVIGIYSENPGFRLSQKDTTINGGRAVPIALAGRVPLKVSTKNGDIKSGDLLAASDIPGVAVKATQAGMTVGRALSPYSSSDPAAIGRVTAFVSMSWSDPTAIGVNLQASATPGVLAPGPETEVGTGEAGGASMLLENTMPEVPAELAGDLKVGGNLSVGMALDVAGTATVQQLAVGGMATIGQATLGSMQVSGSASVGGDLAVAGTAKVASLEISGHIKTTGEAPKLELLAGAGNGDKVKAKIEGNDISGTITLTTGDEAVAESLLKVMFHKAYDKPPRIVLTPVGKQSVLLQPYVDTPTASEFLLGVASKPLSETTYTFNYIVIQ